MTEFYLSSSVYAYIKLALYVYIYIKANRVGWERESLRLSTSRLSYLNLICLLLHPPPHQSLSTAEGGHPAGSPAVCKIWQGKRSPGSGAGRGRHRPWHSGLAAGLRYTPPCSSQAPPPRLLFSKRTLFCFTRDWPMQAAMFRSRSLYRRTSIHWGIGFLAAGVSQTRGRS